MIIFVFRDCHLHLQEHPPELLRDVSASGFLFDHRVRAHLPAQKASKFERKVLVSVKPHYPSF